MNKFEIIGTLNTNVEVSFTTNGTEVANFILSHEHKNKEKKNQVSYFKCVAWGTMAESMKDLQKGTSIFLSGVLKQRRWINDRTGEKCSVVELEVRSSKVQNSQ